MAPDWGLLTTCGTHDRCHDVEPHAVAPVIHHERTLLCTQQIWHNELLAGDKA